MFRMNGWGDVRDERMRGGSWMNGWGRAGYAGRQQLMRTCPKVLTLPKRYDIKLVALVCCERTPHSRLNQAGCEKCPTDGRRPRKGIAAGSLLGQAAGLTRSERYDKNIIGFGLLGVGLPQQTEPGRLRKAPYRMGAGPARG